VTRPITCSRCGVPTEHLCRLCDGCLEARLVAERTAQGLPAKITDPVAIARVAAIIRSARKTRLEREARVAS
jgi:hypothetical protein